MLTEVQNDRDTTSSGLDGQEALSLSDSEFERIVQRVLQQTGIVVEPHKRQMIFARISRRLRELNLTTFSSYLDLLEAGSNAEENQAFINAVTTNLTSFFREIHHFEHLSDKVVKPADARNQTRLRIWSAGCSTGEEPYSIASTLESNLSANRPDFKILATDLDTRVLEIAQSGSYEDKRSDTLPDMMRKFTSKTADKFTFNSEIRNRITFRQLNLLGHWPMKGPFDVIFCRNVLIYFNQATKTQIVARFADLLPAGGFLYLGHSESIQNSHPQLKALGHTIYQKVG